MNRHDRRAEESQQRHASKADILRRAVAALASASDTATGCTVIYPDGATAYISRDTADAMHGRKPAAGRA